MRGTSLPTRDLTPARPREHSSDLPGDQTDHAPVVRTPLPSIVPAQQPPRLWLSTEMWMVTPDNLWAMAWDGPPVHGYQNFQTLLLLRSHMTRLEHAEATGAGFAYVHRDGRIDVGADLKGPGYRPRFSMDGQRRYFAPYRSWDLVDVKPTYQCSACHETACPGCDYAHKKTCSRWTPAKRQRVGSGQWRRR